MADVNKQNNPNKKTKKKPSQANNPVKFVAKKAVKKTVKNMNLNGVQMDALAEAQITGIIKSIAAPKDFDVPRLGSVYASYPTGVAKLFQRQPGFFIDLASAGSFDTCPAYVFRQPYCSFITPIKTNDGYSYSSPPTVVSATSQPKSIQFPFVQYAANPALPVKLHGDALFPGRIPNSDDNYFWCSPQCQIGVLNNLPLAGASINVTRWYNDFKEIVFSGPLPNGGSAAYTVSQPGYYNCSIFISTGFANYNVTLSLSQAAQVSPLVGAFGHFAMPSIFANSNNVNAVKTIGVGLCYTNDASPLNKQGKIVGIQLAAGSLWSNYTNYESLASLNDSESMPAENGIYGFLKPTQPRDLDFMAFETVQNNPIGTDAYFNIVPTSDFLAVVANITVTAGQDGYWTPQYAIEYRTESQFVEVRSPVIAPSVVDTAMMWISKLPQWHENPFHISDIFDWIGDRISDVYNGVKNTLPKIIDTAATVVKYGAPIAAALL